MEKTIIQQFNELKEKHPTAILLFRCGDFYVTYENDAQICANVLGITLTKRTSDGTRTAGFPYHALDTYLPKLVRYVNQPESIMKRIAICDQLEDPQTQKLVKRGSNELTKQGGLTMKLFHDVGINEPCRDIKVNGRKIMANVWGGQTEVTLTTWSEIRRLGFKKRERAFGNLNDGTPALYFQAWDEQNNNHWFLTTEKLEELED